MKKLILSLFIFCSAFASAQISIPQVTGLPAALNSKVDKATGKSLIADTLVAKIQPHVTNLSNPHSVTKSQVGLGNVDNTSDANKPISTATQSALNGKQASGTYSTDIHGNISALNSVSGINTGDETLTSIKTKLGAASSVSDGYLRYQDFALLHTPTTVTASNGLSISGQNISLQNASLTQSGALTFNDWNTFNSKEPAFTKNTAFNKNFGTTTGTVLEGRTFGTAANSAVGDFVQNQNSSAQSANMWISGDVKIGRLLSLSHSYNPFIEFNITDGAQKWVLGGEGSAIKIYNITKGTNPLSISASTGAATFSSTVNSTGFLLNGNNLTSSLSTNYLPKWNGSSFVNATAGTDYQLPITLTTNGTSGAATFSGNVLNVPNYGSSGNSGNGSLTVVGSSNFGSATVISHTYSVIGNIVTESIDCSGTPSSSGVFWIDVAPQYESKATGFTPTGTGTLNNGTIYPATAWIYKSPTSVVRLSSPNGILSTNNRITIMIQYEKQ